MARLTKEQKIQRLKEQEKKIKEQMKEIEQKMQIDIGKAVMEEWEIDDDEIAKIVISELKEQAKQKIESL